MGKWKAILPLGVNNEIKSDRLPKCHTRLSVVIILC